MRFLPETSVVIVYKCFISVPIDINMEMKENYLKLYNWYVIY